MARQASPGHKGDASSEEQGLGLLVINLPLMIRAGCGDFSGGIVDEGASPGVSW